MHLRTVVPYFVEVLKQRKLYSDELIQRIIENHGSLQGIDEISNDLKRRFKVAHDISWKDHIKMQAAFQKWTDNAITKTINMPSTVTPQDVREAYVLAWKLGCKGLTIYRDKTKRDQVFEFGEIETSDKRVVCPNCSGILTKDRKCYKCNACGYSTCEL
jgi:ribonucleoside-diphosphate reductase alpha chain